MGVKDFTITIILVITQVADLNFGPVVIEKEKVMRHYSTIFLVLALITGLIGFVVGEFEGIEIVRVLSLIFTDLFVISLIAKAFFPDEKLQYEEVKR